MALRAIARELKVPYHSVRYWCSVTKTPDSFHGVEPITQPDVQRDLLLYDIKVIKQQQQPAQPGAAAAGPKVKFSF